MPLSFYLEGYPKPDRKIYKRSEWFYLEGYPKPDRKIYKRCTLLADLAT